MTEPMLRRVGSILICLVVAGSGAIVVLTRETVRRPVSYNIGEVSDLPPSIYAAASETLVVFVRSDCPACQASKAFLAELVSAFKSDRDRKVFVAVVPDTAGHERMFASELGAEERQTIVVPPGSVRLKRVPAIQVISTSGRLTFVFEGQPLAADERQIRRALIRRASDGKP